MASRSRRCLAALAVVAAVFGPLVIVPNAEAVKNRFGVVVEHGNDESTVECVELSAEKIRAIDLLSRTDFAVYTTAHPQFGRSICWLDGEGYHPDCFGPNLDDPGWGVWLQKRGRDEPKSASVGVSSLSVPAGAVLYFQFDQFASSPPFEQPPPGTVKLRTICNPDE
jgi:hypothetical protein